MQTEAKNAASVSPPPNPSNPPATFMRRLAAMFYDMLLLIAVIMGGTAIAIGVRILFVGVEAVNADPQGPIHGLAFQLFLLCLLYGFFLIFWRRGGQTLGMQAWRLKAQNKDGSLLSVKQCSLRMLGGLLSWVCAGLGYLFILFSSERKSWSDSLSSSQIVQLPKKKD